MKVTSSDPELMRAFLLRPDQVEPLIRRIACNPCRHGFPKACHRKQGRARYGDSPRRYCFDVIKEHLYRNTEYVARLRKIIGRSKNVPCLDCKRHKPDRMTYDHLPQFIKCFDIGKVGHEVYPSVKELVEEIAKCQVICRECHDRREQVRHDTWKAEMLALATGLMPWFQLGCSVVQEAKEAEIAKMESLTPWFALSRTIRKHWYEWCRIGRVIRSLND